MTRTENRLLNPRAFHTFSSGVSSEVERERPERTKAIRRVR
jgi:hypothetical protein